MIEDAQDRDHDEIERSEIYPEGQNQFAFFDKFNYEKKSQCLFMKTWTVHKDVKDKDGKLIPTLTKRKPINKMFNNNQNFENQDDILDLLFKRNNKNFKDIRIRQITILNKFYQKSSQGVSSQTPQGSVKSKDESLYCRVPKIQFKSSQAPPRCFTIKETENRYKQKQALAKTFINKGYGAHCYQNDFLECSTEIKIETKRYRNLLASILTQAYRKLQNFVIQQCCMDIRKVNRAELKLLFLVFLNIRSLLSPQDCQTFLKYIKICFCLGDVQITAEESVKLMNTIQQNLKKRISERIGQIPQDAYYHSGNELMWTSKGGFTNEKLQLHRIWNGQLQRLLINEYKKNQNMNRIARQFKKIYPKKQYFFTPESLQARLNRTIRESIKKLQYLRQNQCDERMPQIIKIYKPTFKAILDSPRLYRLRVMLLEVNLCDQCDQKLVYRTIELLNGCGIAWEGDSHKDLDYLEELEDFELEIIGNLDLQDLQSKQF